MSRKYWSLVMFFLVVPVVALWAQTVTCGTGGTFPTLAAAISSFRTGGSNFGNSEPNVINCLDATYDEVLPIIDVQLTINGASPESTILARDSGVGDGLSMNLPASTQVDLNNLIILPSATTTPSGNLIYIVAAGANPIVNFNSCIISSNYSGNPASMDGMTAPVGSPTARPGTKGLWATAPAGINGLTVNMSATVVTDACGPTGETYADNILFTGDGASIWNITNGSVISYATRLNIQCNGGTLNITGTHDKPIYLIKAQRADDGIALATWYQRPIAVNLQYCIIADNMSDGLQLHQDQTTLTMNHVIVANNGGYGLSVVDLFVAAWTTKITAENVTIAGNGAQLVSPATKDQVNLIQNLVNAASFTGCIFANGDNGFNIGASSIANATYCALVLAGPNALGAKKIGDGTLNETSVITDDPQFVNTTDFLSSSYFDVYNTAYETANNGSPLVGGADYAAWTPTPTPFGFADVTKGWTLYW